MAQNYFKKLNDTLELESALKFVVNSQSSHMAELEDKVKINMNFLSDTDIEVNFSLKFICAYMDGKLNIRNFHGIKNFIRSNPSIGAMDILDTIASEIKLYKINDTLQNYITLEYSCINNVDYFNVNYSNKYDDEDNLSYDLTLNILCK